MAKGVSTRPKDDSEIGTSLVIKIFQKCAMYRITDIVIKRLHFDDLLALIVEMDIQEIGQLLNEKERRKNKSKGFEVINATPEMAGNFFGFR